MKKITQNLTNHKAWQSTIFAFLFLFSLTINAQEVGQEYIGNPDINTTNTSPETGSNVTSGNFSGATNAGSWGFGQQGSYAPCGDNPGCYSEDRMFKMFKKNGENGQQYITQTITALPAGNYDWSYWNRWGANGGVFPTWSADGDETPSFVILTDDDGDGTWTSVQENENVSTEPTGSTWYQESGTYTNDIARDVKIKFTKTGGSDSSALTNLAHLWYLDNASLAYASALEATSDCDFTINVTDSYGDSWNGASVELFANGVSIGSYANTSDAGANVAQSTTFGINEGDVITSVWAPGSYDGETSYTITDSFGNVVASVEDGDAMTAFTATCVEDVAAAMTASVAVDGANATISISTDNFVISDDGTGDGHWHYTLDGGSTVMVYDTNDVSLTGLANGDHTLVAWLVDNNHDALNPAIEETITFSTFDGTYGGTYPYCSSFDADLDNWTAEEVTGDANWSSASANQNSSVTPLTGAGMAYMYDNSSVANLISPSMDLSAVANPQVTFSHTQVEWAGDQDELRVWYKAASGDAWTELAAYTAEVTAWTEVTLDLPSPSATYFIAFNGTAGYGRGMTIDDVCVHEGSGDPNTVLADPTLGWVGYMNVFDLTGGAQGGYLFGSAWGVDAVATTLNTDTDYMTVTLEPNYNTYADNPGDAYWQDGSGGGAKWMEGSTYVESAADWNNADLTFTGYVYHHSLATDWTANVFIKALDPNNGYADALNGAYVTALPTDGMFSVTVPAGELAVGFIVQAGFAVNGPNANPDNQAANGKVILGGDVDAPMSIDDVNVLDMRIYPNPVDGNFVTILSPINGTKYVQVFDIMGKRVMDTSINNNTLDVSSINSGFYMIKVTIDGQSKISKLIVR